MGDLSRREILVGAAAIAAAANLPALPAVAAPAEIMPAWFVGSTDGGWDWQHVIAKTEELAKQEWATSWSSGKCECEPEAGDCEYCCALYRCEAVRHSEFDGKEHLTRGDWIRAGMGTYCSRCDCETYGENGASAIGDEAVCENCMTLADWDIADPDHAAEMRAELADDDLPTLPPADGGGQS